MSLLKKWFINERLKEGQGGGGKRRDKVEVEQERSRDRGMIQDCLTKRWHCIGTEECMGCLKIVENVETGRGEEESRVQ